MVCNLRSYSKSMGYFEEAKLFKSHSKSISFNYIIFKGVALYYKIFFFIYRKVYCRFWSTVNAGKIVGGTFPFWVEDSDVEFKIAQHHLKSNNSILRAVLDYFGSNLWAEPFLIVADPMTLCSSDSQLNFLFCTPEAVKKVLVFLSILGLNLFPLRVDLW